MERVTSMEGSVAEQTREKALHPLLEPPIASMNQRDVSAPSNTVHSSIPVAFNG